MAVGLTPQMSHDDSIYPLMGESAKSGKYRPFADVNRTVIELIGEILHELEEDIEKA